MASLLTTAGCGLEDLAFITVYLSSLEDYDEMNRAYAEALPSPFPARKVVQTAHTIDGMLVEMTAVASTAPRESPAS
jgi:enamine deaminase RidA (YjgF/YER057c/UK114 family)